MGKSETKKQEKVATQGNTQGNKGMDVPKEMSILSNRIQKLQSRIQSLEMLMKTDMDIIEGNLDITLMDGRELKGCFVKDINRYTILVEHNDRTCIIHKHGVMMMDITELGEEDKA